MVCPFNTRCEQSMAVGRLALILAFALGSIKAQNCDLPGHCTNHALGVDFVDSRDECLQECIVLQQSQVRKDLIGLIVQAVQGSIRDVSIGALTRPMAPAFCMRNVPT